MPKNTVARGGQLALIAVVVTSNVINLVNHNWVALLTVSGALLSWSGLWINMHTRTVVTHDRIIVQRGLRRRGIPASDIEVVAEPAAWSPITARLSSGETVVLPMLETAQDATIINNVMSQVSHSRSLLGSTKLLFWKTTGFCLGGHM